MGNKIYQFGKDHWSLFAYVEFRVMNHQGRLDLVHLRIKNPALQQNRMGISSEWKPEYGTRLFGYFEKKNSKLLLTDHDDFDCLDDLEEAGLIESFGTGINPAYKLTKKGVSVMGALTLHKQEDKNFCDFVFDEKLTGGKG